MKMNISSRVRILGIVTTLMIFIAVVALAAFVQITGDVNDINSGDTIITEAGVPLAEQPDLDGTDGSASQEQVESVYDSDSVDVNPVGKPIRTRQAFKHDSTAAGSANEESDEVRP